MSALESRLFASPALFPQKIDLRTERALFIEVDRRFYKNASFLDDRILGNDLKHFWAALSELDKVETKPAPPPAHYIFHHGHCGSTLLSRLLDAAPGTLALREPLILRMLADLLLDVETTASVWSRDTLLRRLSSFVKLFARRFSEDSAVVVKTSSFCGDLGQLILQLEPVTLAAAIYVPLSTYMTTMLGGPNTPRELQALAPNRLRRLRRRLDASSWGSQPLEAGECAAMSWTTEMLALHDLARVAAGRWKWIEFDALLAAPLDQLTAIFSHFRIAIDAKRISSIVDGPTLKTYSKAPEYEFDQATRRSLLAEYGTAHATEIARGLRWFESAAAKFPELALLCEQV